MMDQVKFAAIAGHADEEHAEIISDTMDEFKVLFKEWVATFYRDEIEDEWGLFDKHI